jgi:hypothetical protein
VVGPVLIEEVPDDGCHAVLVLLAHAVDVEVAKADDLRGAIREHAPRILVEQALRIRVHVERSLMHALFAKYGARTVNRGTRCVEKRHIVVLAPIEQRD